MPDALLLCAAVAVSYAGFGWLALAMDVHWRQVRGPRLLPRRLVVALRLLGAAGLSLSLFLCLLADYASIAALVWVMALAAAAFAVAFTLTWRPRLLAPLVVWIPVPPAS